MAISPQTVEYNQALKSEKNLSYEILSDPGNRVAEAYGLRFTLAPALKELYVQFGIDLPKHNGDESWTLPLPTRIVIGTDGRIAEINANVDHTIRPEPEDTLALVKGLVAQ